MALSHLLPITRNFGYTLTCTIYVYFSRDNCVKENCVFKRSSCCRQFEIITNNQKKENEKKKLKSTA